MIATASPTLDSLAAERATGALLGPAGTVYLADGAVVHAESPAAPGIEVLLAGGGRLPAEQWQEALDHAGAGCGVGRFLVDTGRLAAGELEMCHLGALFDAAFFALPPGGGPARFRHGAAHWLGPVRAVRADTVARENRRRRRLLDEVWPCPQIDTSPVVRRAVPGRRAVTRRQRAVLALADGGHTPVRIARLLGRPAFATLLDVRRLAAAGHVETPGTTRIPGPPTSPAWIAEVSADPDITLLRRLRDALEASL